MAGYLMDGVKILNTNPPERFVGAFIYIIGFIALAFLFSFTEIVFNDFFADAKINIIVSIVVAIIIGSVIGYIIWNYDKKEVLPETYDVTIDESVSFREFDKKYEVIERNGEIYTIKERISNG